MRILWQFRIKSKRWMLRPWLALFVRRNTWLSSFTMRRRPVQMYWTNWKILTSNFTLKLTFCLLLKPYLYSLKSSEADVFKIRFVRIFDNELAADYSLYKMPCLVYFRNGIPVVYDGELKDESEVLEWLIQHQTSIDEEDIVENASKVRHILT